VDGCYANSTEYATLYPEFGAALNATGRPIFYYCSWPAYIDDNSGRLANFTQIGLSPSLSLSFSLSLSLSLSFSLYLSLSLSFCFSLYLSLSLSLCLSLSLFYQLILSLSAIYCNGWRAYGDIQDSASSMFSIVNWWSQNQKELVPAAGPGAWNDADRMFTPFLYVLDLTTLLRKELLIGDFGLSSSQSICQFCIW